MTEEFPAQLPLEAPKTGWIQSDVPSKRSNAPRRLSADARAASGLQGSSLQTSELRCCGAADPKRTKKNPQKNPKTKREPDLKAHESGEGEFSGGVGGIERVFVGLRRPTDVQEQTGSADLEEIMFASLKTSLSPR